MEVYNDRQPQEEIHIFDEVHELPLYYSERAVRIFSILMGVFFASILIAMNFSRTQGRKGIWQVITFGVLYTAVELYVLNLLPNSNSGLTFVFNIAGAYVLQVLFWSKFIGKSVPYNKRSVVVPAIIALIIAALLVWCVVYSSNLTT